MSLVSQCVSYSHPPLSVPLMQSLASPPKANIEEPSWNPLFLSVLTINPLESGLNENSHFLPWVTVLPLSLWLHRMSCFFTLTVLAFLLLLRHVDIIPSSGLCVRCSPAWSTFFHLTAWPATSHSSWLTSNISSSEGPSSLTSLKESHSQSHHPVSVLHSTQTASITCYLCFYCLSLSARLVGHCTWQCT